MWRNLLCIILRNFDDGKKILGLHFWLMEVVEIGCLDKTILFLNGDFNIFHLTEKIRWQSHELVIETTETFRNRADKWEKVW